MPHSILFSKDGLNKFRQELTDLQSKRPTAVDNLRLAREMGDLSENGAYKAARQELGRIDSRLRYLANIIKNAVIADDKSKDEIIIGSKVTLESDGKTYKYEIVGSFESNPSEGKISHISPLGKQLMGRKQGSIINLSLPSGITSYKIISIL